MSILKTNNREKNRILKLHLQEQTTTSSSGAYETPKAFDREGDLTNNNNHAGIVGVELGMSLPDEVDITGGNIGSFKSVDMDVCPTCGICHEGPCNFSEMSDEIDNEVFDVDISMDDPVTLKDFKNTDKKNDFLPDSLFNLFGDINIGGDLEIELDEEPKKLKGSRKFRR